MKRLFTLLTALIFSQAWSGETERPRNLEEWSLTATAVECGVYGNTFTGPLFSPTGEASKPLEAFVSLKIKRRFDPKRDSKPLKGMNTSSPACELFAINALGLSDPDLAKERCIDSRDFLFLEKNLPAKTAPLTEKNFSLDSFSYGGTAHQEVAPDCETDLESKTEAFQFACSTKAFRERVANKRKDLDAALLLCTHLGVNMNDVKKETLKQVQVVNERKRLVH